tara:strand:+ start:394 stop:600 length:207 start_codon:yes stop_codon:yes gene_type:complete
MEEKLGAFGISATYFTIAAGISLITSNYYIEETSKYFLYGASAIVAAGGLVSLCCGFGKQKVKNLEEA